MVFAYAKSLRLRGYLPSAVYTLISKFLKKYHLDFYSNFFIFLDLIIGYNGQTDLPRTTVNLWAIYTLSLMTLRQILLMLPPVGHLYPIPNDPMTKPLDTPTC